MADISKAEKLAAARKMLRQFQSKAKGETTTAPVPSRSASESSATTNGSSHNSHNKPSESDKLQQQVNVHFEAIDPTYFGADKLIETHQPDVQSMPSTSVNLLGNAVNNNGNADQQPALQSFQYFSTNAVNPLDDKVAPFIPLFPSASAATTNETMQAPLVNLDGSQKRDEPFVDMPAPMATANFFSNSVQSPITDQNQELANLLQVEKVRNHELSVKVTQQHSTIEALSKNLEQMQQRSALADELQRQLNAHQQTVGILVGEKTDLSAKLQQREQRITEFEAECMELNGRLKASRHRVAELEKDLNVLTQSHQKYDGTRQALCTELETLQDDNKRLQRQCQEANDENAEIQHQLALKTKEIDELQHKLNAKCNEVEMTQLRLEQLGGNDVISSNDTANQMEHKKQQDQLDTERQIIELQNMISELTNDRDRTQQQYQTYVQHLTNETNTMTQRIQELTKANEKLTKREESLVDHVRDLERQFQKQISTQQRLAALREGESHQNTQNNESKESLAPPNTNGSINNELKELQEKLANSEKAIADLNNLLDDHNKQKLTLQQQLLEKDTKLAELETALERLQAEKPDTTNILATMESDKIAASRAVAQNQELKNQLEEIQKAFVQISNDKLELTDQLQSEQHVNRDVRTRFGDIESELKSVKEQLHFKDEEMIRLAHENSNLESKINDVERELSELKSSASEDDAAQQIIALKEQLLHLRKENTRLMRKLGEKRGDVIIESHSHTCSDDQAKEKHDHHCGGHEHQHSAHNHEDHTNDHHGHEHHGHDHHGHDHQHSHDHHHDDQHSHDHHSEHSTSTVNAIDNSDVVSVTSTINIATNEAMDKLQDRFKRTMTEIADLTEEKQRLEHLVMQLQSETETIGEYIALYQTQRRLLKQREVEKDIQLNRIAADREDMKDKLRQLNELVEVLLVQKGVPNAKQIMEQLHQTNNNHLGENHLNGDEKQSDTIDANAVPANTEHQQHSEEHQTSNPAVGHESSTRETATKIINLLTEIKDKNLREDFSVPNSLHHCACCSGKLEVV